MDVTRWRVPGDFLYPDYSGVYMPRPMIQIIKPLPDRLLSSPMNWYPDGEPGPWRWLQPGDEILRERTAA